MVPVFKNAGERSTAKKYHSLVVSDRTARAFNRSEVTQAVALDIKAFGRIWHAGLLHKLNPLSTNFTKWSNTLKQFVGKIKTNFLSVFDHFVGLALKGLSLTEFQVRYLALLLFSVIEGFMWFWMGNLLKNIQLMLWISSRVHSCFYTFPE